jgi:hypothetical protein
LQFEDDKSLISLYWEVNDYFAEPKNKWGAKVIRGWGVRKEDEGMR